MNAEELLNILGWKPEDLQNLMFVSFSYIKQGKFLVAQTLLEALNVLSPSNAFVLQTLGAVYIENKRPYDALNTLEQAFMLDPSNETIQYNRVQALISLGLKKQALDECQKLKQAQTPLIKQRAEAMLLSEFIA